MKVLMKRDFFRSLFVIFLIIIMTTVMVGAIYLIIINRDYVSNFFTKFSEQKQTDIYSNYNIPFAEQEYKNLLGYNFYTKDNGTVIVTSNDAYKMPNIPSSGNVTFNVSERVVKIEACETEIGKTSSIVVLLTENGNLYKLDLGQTNLNVSCLTKYAFDKKINNITSENFQGYRYNRVTVATLVNGETRLVGPNTILSTPSSYYVGKKVVLLSNEEIYITIDNSNRIRIGNFLKDKYFNISQEKWINDNINVKIYSYLKDSNDAEIKAKYCDVLTENGTVSLYVITTEGKLMCLKLSEASLLTDSKILVNYEIKTNKQVSEFVSNTSSGTLKIKFTDNSIADIKGDNLIFGMLSNNNKFFTFSKQDLKNNIDYKILADKSGLNYKVKDYEVIGSTTTTTESTYVINVFMITEDNKLFMTRISNDVTKDYIEQMNVVEVISEKLITAFERGYSNNNEYTINIVFKDGTKVDLKSFVKKYL